MPPPGLLFFLRPMKELAEPVPLFAQPGALPQSDLEELVRKVRALDMGEVRRVLAERQASETA